MSNVNTLFNKDGSEVSPLESEKKSHSRASETSSALIRLSSTNALSG